MIAFGIGTHRAAKKTVFISIKSTALGTAENESVTRVPVVSKNVVVSDPAINIQRQLGRSYLSSWGELLLQAYRKDIFYARIYCRYGSRRGIRRFRQSYGQWVRLWSDANPLTNIVGWSFAEILKLRNPFRLLYVLSKQNDLRDSDIGSQISNFSFFHLSDYSFCLLGRRSHLRFLSLGDLCLPSGNSESSKEQPYLKNTGKSEQSTKTPIAPINPISFSGCYRHGGKFADRYGMVCIFASILGGIGIGATGLILIDSGRRSIGWLVFFLVLCWSPVRALVEL